LIVHKVLDGVLIQSSNQNASGKQKKYQNCRGGSALNSLEKQTLPKAHVKCFRGRYKNLGAECVPYITLNPGC